MSSKQTSAELIEQGLAALELAEFEEAIELFGQAAVEDSTNPQAWFYLGLCYLETREAELAVESFNRAIAADPGYADAHYLLGTANGALGRLEQAADGYRRALVLDPHHHKAEEFLFKTEAMLASREHYRAGMRLIYAEEREPDYLSRAARELLHSVAIFSESPARTELQHLAREIIASGRSRKLADAGCEQGPFWARAVERAERALARRSWPEAAASYHEALDLSADHAFIHHALGLIYFALGDDESGTRAWQRALDLDADYDFSALGQRSP